MSREACLSLGSGANYSEMRTYLLHCCTIIAMPSQFCLVTMLLYTIVNASHVRLA